MEKGNKIYWYAGAVFISAVAAYFLITKKKKTGAPLINENTDTQVTVTENTISSAQATIPKELQVIFNQPVTEAAKLIGPKKIYSKLPMVNARKTAGVNNGILNNSWGIVQEQGTLLGVIVAVSDDINKAKNPDGRVYKWLKVNLSVPARESINSQSNSIFSTDFNLSVTIPAYFREDTIIIK